MQTVVRRKRHGVVMISHFLKDLDRWWCRDLQIPASLMETVSEDEDAPLTLASWRLFGFLSTLGEVISLFLVLFFLIKAPNTPILFSLALFSYVLFQIASSQVLNQSAALLKRIWCRNLDILKQYKQEFTPLLANLGFTEEETSSILRLPDDVYQIELQGYSRVDFLHKWIPIAVVSALLLFGDPLTALVIIGVALIAYPLGKLFFQKFIFRKERLEPIALSSANRNLFLTSEKSHLKLVFFVNLFSVIPMLLFGFRFLIDTQSAFVSYLSLTIGLSGLIGTLDFQRRLVNSNRVCKLAKHLVEIISGKNFLITKKQYSEHEAQQSGNGVDVQFEGLQIHQFAPSVPTTESSTLLIKPINAKIRTGSICVIDAPSGIGKSLFILSLLHYTNHSGDVYLYSDRNVLNVHEIGIANWRKKIAFFRQENFPQSARLVDLQKQLYPLRFQAEYSKMVFEFGKDLAEQVFATDDDLLEKELIHMSKGDFSIFPKDSLQSILHIRNLKISSLKEDLFRFQLSKIDPCRRFSSLSSGEKKRFTNLLTCLTVQYDQNVVLAIFDEPFANLDQVARNEQKQRIEEHISSSNRVSGIVITHQSQKELLANERLYSALTLHEAG